MSESSPGRARFARMFAAKRQSGQLALLPYVMAGYPRLDTTVPLLRALADAGADGFELGMPFSDPLADGPTVQRAGQVALGNGVTPAAVLDLLRQARRDVDLPIALMGYMNPLVRYGVAGFCRDAAEAGADALIIPDVPPEESGELAEACDASGLDLVAFVAPTTLPARLARIAKAARGFVYCVSLTGVTGARSQLAEGLDRMLADIRASTETPVVVGFGISQPEHVSWLVGRADGAIVASALIDLIERHPEDPITTVASYLSTLKEAAESAVPAAVQ